MRLLLAIALTSLCCIAAAADNPKIDAARRLVELMQFDQAYRDVDNACQNRKPGDAHAAYAADPQAFGGISPRSAYWGDVEALYSAYWVAACGTSDTAAIKNIYVQVYANRLSLAELQYVIASMESPAGRQTQVANLEAARLMIAYQQERQEQNVAKATDRFERALREMMAKYKAAPR